MSYSKRPESAQEKSEMTQPFPSNRCPKNMKLVPGKAYLYCACGLSKEQPFCDGSHEGTPFEPIPFVAKNHVISSICLCRRAKQGSLPYCDGSHNDIDF